MISIQQNVKLVAKFSRIRLVYGHTISTHSVSNLRSQIVAKFANSSTTDNFDRNFQVFSNYGQQWHCQICNKNFVANNVEESKRIHMASHETKCFIEEAPEVTINENTPVPTTNQEGYTCTEWECHICKKVFTGTEEAKKSHFATHEDAQEIVKLE